MKKRYLGREMRIICPNCDAQYEVPDNVMPTAGRDVQCSNCGQTWYQHHPDHMPEAQDAAPPPHEDISPPAATPPSPTPAASTQPIPPQVSSSAASPSAASQKPAATPERKQLDPAVADILREEAQTEKAARKAAQPSALESQPDLGLDLEEAPLEDDADRLARQARARMGSDEALQPARPADAKLVAGAATTSLGSRRDLLPDIEEINSTLRSGAAPAGTAGEAPEYEAPTRKRMRRGFRTGFLTVMMIFIVLGTLYISAPRLAAAVPALEPSLQAYVAAINSGRAWLDATLQSVLTMLDTAAQDGAAQDGAGEAPTNP